MKPATTWGQLRELVGGAASRWFLLAAGLGVVLTAVELLAAKVSFDVLRALTAARPSVSPFAAVLLVLGCAGLRAALAGSVQAASLYLNAGVSQRIRLSAVQRLLSGTLPSESATEALFVRFQEHAPRVAQVCQLAATNLATLVQLAALGCAVIWLFPKQGGVALLAYGAIGLLAFRATAATRGIGQRALAAQQRLAQGFERATRNLLLVRVLRLEREEYAEIQGAISEHTRLLQRGVVRGTAASLAVLALVALPLVGLVEWAPGDPARLALLLYLLVRLAMLAAGLVHGISLTRAALPTVRAALRDARHAHDVADARTPLASPVAPGEPSARARSSAPAHIAPCHLRFELVGFRYEPDAPFALEQIQLDVPPGALAGIRGPSGAGKTTLGLLALGLLRPTSGRVVVDGEAPELYFAEGRMRASYVGGDPCLLAGSIGYNLRYGCPWSPPDAALFEALRRCRMEEEVRNLPRGLEHPLGEQGAGLSLGQRQRISLARALLRRPALLVLDEPTANLDGSTEAAILATLQSLRGEVTCLVMSHRSEVQMACDPLLTLPVRARGASDVVPDNAAEGTSGDTSPDPPGGPGG